MHLAYGGIEAGQAFRESLANLQEIIDAHEDGIPPLEKATFPQNGNAVNRYERFCMKHRLLLNAWVGDQTLAPAMTDEIAFSSITMRQRDSHIVSELLRILNEIKEAYSTARYLFYLSQSQSTVLDGISKITFYFDADTEDLHGLYIGLCKSAYMRSFDVLDKVARIINVYFGIGKRRDYFWYVFAEKQSRGESHEIRYMARSAIAETHNYSLYALSDLCIDYFESEYVDFKTIDIRRNQMTHDYLAVPQQSIEATALRENELSLSELRRQTLSALQLAKLATLYAVSAVSVAEGQKDSAKNSGRMKYKQSPGHTAKALKRA